MEINLEYELGEVVYFKTDPDNRQFIVTGITLRPPNNIFYLVSHSEMQETVAYGIEISSEKTVVI